MPRPLRVEVYGGVYHVIARGNERMAIFRDDRDREIYLERLGECRNRLKFRVLAHCLMDNHVHLALGRGPNPLSRIMLTLQSFYAQKCSRPRLRRTLRLDGGDRFPSRLAEIGVRIALPGARPHDVARRVLLGRGLALTASRPGVRAGRRG